MSDNRPFYISAEDREFPFAAEEELLDIYGKHTGCWLDMPEDDTQ